ncbi:hypothetical protein WHZ77_05960 [Bradyrhizobium sp. A5]|uniref:hypothetical protein n=1 Tax=Bradyrhizobium sp. A5 TaxID=3133696 RepID=UPI003247B562
MAWSDEVFRTLSAAGQIGEGIAGTRNALYGVWRLIDGAPSAVRDLYRAFEEDRLEREAEALPPEDIFTLAPVSAKTRREKENLLFSVAVRLRALEKQLFLLSSGAPARRSASVTAVFENEQAYVLMWGGIHRTAKTGDSFRRRGLSRARLIPKTINGLDVKLEMPDDPRGRERKAGGIGLSMGAGLFEGMRFDFRKVDGDGFIVVDATATGQVETIFAQISDASRRHCAAIVYPELTISSATLQRIETGLSESSSGDCTLSMIVAGSRHAVEGDGRVFNVCTVLNGYGGVIAEHRKLFSFNEGTSREAIELGSELQVLVLEEAVFAFGICLDFCNLCEDPPYLDLDTDYVVVPSCGEESTMQSHIQRSTEILTKLKCRSLVVQQLHREKPRADDPLGFVLARTDKAVPELSALATKDPWRVYDI